MKIKKFSNLKALIKNKYIIMYLILNYAFFANILQIFITNLHI